MITDSVAIINAFSRIDQRHTVWPQPHSFPLLIAGVDVLIYWLWKCTPVTVFRHAVCAKNKAIMRESLCRL